MSLGGSVAQAMIRIRDPGCLFDMMRATTVTIEMIQY
jgi:hypothetical protein